MKDYIYDILFWTSMSITILWIILKLTGVINTPEWVQLIPIITIVFTAGITFQKQLSFNNKMLNRTDYLKIKIEQTQSLIQENQSFIQENQTNITSIQSQYETIISLLKKK
ncbi:MAG: hypothetical protein KJ592_01090 [Nanoarchaeota archaeon]|nr:hypothetical protein [Nanoarchaeota archaeon]